MRFLSFLAFILALTIPSLAMAATMYKVNNGSSVTIDEHGICRQVTNSRGIAVMVPTRTSTEWSSFINHAPSGVSVGSCGCALPWGGTIANGATVTAYASSTVPCGDGCGNGKTITCNGSTLSPAGYNYASCSENACTRGYFVMVNEDHTGDYNGLEGANTYCRNKLRSKNWLGKGTSSVNVDNKVKAWLCDSSTCQNLKANQKYYFARTGTTSVGGAHFTTDGSKRGPGDSANWSGSTYFGYSYGVWSGRESTSSTLWKNSPAGSTCNNWNSSSHSVGGDYGYMNDSGEQRWVARWNGFNEVPQGCDADLGDVRTICFVNP